MGLLRHVIASGSSNEALLKTVSHFVPWSATPPGTSGQQQGQWREGESGEEALGPYSHTVSPFLV